MIVLLLVNALGEKKDPIIIGKTQQSRCFKQLKNKKRPCAAHYCANKRTWIESELMEEILGKLNRRCAATDSKLSLFMDNAPCPPENLDMAFSHVKY